MRRRAAALAVAAAVAVALAGCGDGDEPARVAWQGEPALGPHPELPDQRLLVGRVRNDSDHELRMDAASVRVVDRGGRAVRATVRFNVGVTHALYPPRDRPRERPREEAERLGDAATLKPGRSAPLVVAWRAGAPGRTPVRLDLGPASLRVPAAP